MLDLDAAPWSAPVGHGDHACGLFDSADDLAAATVAFVREGLAAGDQVWCLPEPGAQRAVLRLLTRDGLSADESVERGQLAVRASDEVYLSGAAFDADRIVGEFAALVDAALADGYGGLRVVADMGWITRAGVPTEQVLDYEESLVELFAARPVAGMCQYDRRAFCAGRLERLAAVHPLVISSERDVVRQLVVGVLPDGEGLRLAGEVDVSNRDKLREALAPFAGQGDVVLELSGLKFVDVTGAAVLGGFAVRRPPGSRLVLRNPPYVLRRILKLAWGHVPGMEVR